MASIGTKKVDLGDGDWADILTELTHGTARKVQDVTRRFLKAPDAKLSVAEGDDGKLKSEVKAKEIDVDWDKADFTQADDILIIGQTSAWSFGEEVSQAVLDTIPERKRDALLKACDEEYNSRPLPESGGES